MTYSLNHKSYIKNVFQELFHNDFGYRHVKTNEKYTALLKRYKLKTKLGLFRPIMNFPDFTYKSVPKRSADYLTGVKEEKGHKFKAKQQ